MLFLLLFGLCGSLYGAEPQPAPQATPGTSTTALGDSVNMAFPAPEAPQGTSATWAGVDETVVEKYAEAAGRPGRAPLINTDQGDLLLFVFLLAGAIGGFVAGYAYRSLAQPGRKAQLVLLLGTLFSAEVCRATEAHTDQHLPHHPVEKEAECPVSFEALFSFYSLDIWNGMVGYDHPLFQPSLRVAYEHDLLGTFSLESVFLFPLGSPRPVRIGGLSEADYIVCWSRSLAWIDVEVGATYYSLPPEHDDDLYEGFASVRYENDWVTPYITGYYDFNQTDGAYLKAGLCRTFKLMERLSADIDLCSGYGLPNYNRSYFDIDRSAFTDATLQILLQYDITDYLFIGGTAAFSMLLDNSIRDSQVVNEAYDTIDTFWFGLHTGIHF